MKNKFYKNQTFCLLICYNSLLYILLVVYFPTTVKYVKFAPFSMTVALQIFFP